MPKLKTHKGAQKRANKKKSGRVLYRHSGKNHLRSKKSSARKRRLAKAGEAFGAIKRLFKKLSF